MRYTLACSSGRLGRLPGAVLVVALVAGCATTGSAAVAFPTGGTPSPPTVTPSPTPTVTPTVTPSPTPTAGPSRARIPDVITTIGVPFTPLIRCASPDDPDATCQLKMDIVAPSSGGPWPIFVLLPGGPGPVVSQDYLLDLATSLAQRGAVAVVAPWRQAPRYGGGYPTSFQDIGCAIGVARRLGPSLGGNPGRVVLVGHSLGGWAGAVVALTTTPYRPAPGACNTTAGSLRPDAFADLDGNVDSASPNGSFAGVDMVDLLGGDRSARAEAWAAADVYALVKRRAQNDDPAPILVAHGDADPVVMPSVARAFDALLAEGAYQHRLLIVPGDHGAPLDSRATINALMALAAGG
jgi:acetyl esterase/lipase